MTLEMEMATHSSVSCLGNPMDKGAWQAILHGVSRVRQDLVIKTPETKTLYSHLSPIIMDPLSV